MDIFSAAWEFYIWWIQQMPDAVFCYLLRVNLLLSVPIIVAYISFTQGIRDRRFQLTLMVAGAMGAISLPLHHFIALKAFFPWLFIVLLIGCWYLPLVFSFLAHPHPDIQKKITTWTRYIIAVLFILNFVLCR